MTSTGPQPPTPPEPTPPEPTPPELVQPGSQPGAPAGWAWAQHPVQEQVVETEPLDYHRLLRGVQNYRWWKPLVLLLVAGAYFGVFTIALVMLFVPLSVAIDPDYATDLATGAGEVLDTQRPISVLLALSSIIIMIPAVLLAMLTLGMRPVGRVWSVAAKIRWGLFFRLVGVAVVALIVMNAVGIGAGLIEVAITDPTALTDPQPLPERDFDVIAALISLALIIVLVPFQAVAEELVFRGLFMQVIGAWLKSPWFAILIPSVGFALAHIYDIWGLAAVGLLGGVAAWLTWRTGGLEAAMAIHIVNNLIVFMILTSGIAGETAQTTEGGGLAGVIGEIAGLAVFIWLTLAVFKRGGYGRSRIDLVRVTLPLNGPVSGPLPGADSGSVPGSVPGPGSASSGGPHG
ncbi:MAG: type II CAAX endopeptidase family protein [Leucobacter sp.]